MTGPDVSRTKGSAYVFERRGDEFSLGPAEIAPDDATGVAAAAVIGILPDDPVEAANIIARVLAMIFATSSIPIDGIGLAGATAASLMLGVREVVAAGGAPDGAAAAAALQEIALLVANNVGGLPPAEVLQVGQVLMGASRAELNALALSLAILKGRKGDPPPLRRLIDDIARQIGEPAQAAPLIVVPR